MSVFTAVAEPQRRRILDALIDQERPVGELVRELGMSQPLVSKHLRVLRQAGLVGTKVDAQRRLYSVRPQALLEVERWLAPYRKVWGDALGRLDRHLGETAESPGRRGMAGARGGDS